MSTSCRVGALAAGLPRDRVDAFTRYGNRVGMVFQIADDILDIIAGRGALGKPAGNDVIEGVYTLPVLRAMAEPRWGDELRSLLGGPLDTAVVERVRELMKASRAVDASIATARTFADEAGRRRPVPRPRPGPARGLGHALLDGLPTLARPAGPAAAADRAEGSGLLRRHCRHERDLLGRRGHGHAGLGRRREGLDPEHGGRRGLRGRPPRRARVGALLALLVPPCPRSSRSPSWPTPRSSSSCSAWWSSCLPCGPSTRWWRRQRRGRHRNRRWRGRAPPTWPRCPARARPWA